jgi:hypothetical protein
MRFSTRKQKKSVRIAWNVIFATTYNQLSSALNVMATPEAWNEKRIDFDYTISLAFHLLLIQYRLLSLFHVHKAYSLLTQSENRFSQLANNLSKCFLKNLWYYLHKLFSSSLLWVERTKNVVRNRRNFFFRL